MEKLKKRLVLENLLYIHYSKGIHFLEFKVDYRSVTLLVRGLEPKEDNFWNKPETLKDFVEKATIEDFRIK